MTIRDCMSSHTYREYRLWANYFKYELNNPDRTDHYLMRIAAEIRSSNAENDTEIDLNEFKINFTFKSKEPEKVELTPEEKAQKAKEFSQKFISAFKAAYGKTPRIK